MMDDERALLLQTFQADAVENLARLEEGLIALEQRPDDVELVHGVFRAMHSLKGDASLVGFDRLGELADRAEDVLEGLRARSVPVTRALIGALLEAADVLGALVEGALAGRGDPSAAQVETFNRLARVARGLPVDTGGSAPSDAPAPMHARTQALRVGLDKLDRLLTLAGEIGIARRRMDRVLARISAPGLAKEVHEALDLQDHTDRLFAELQEQIMKARMVPVGPLFRSYRRIVRDLAEAHGKRAHLELEGAEAEIDAGLVETVREALSHLIRNAIDHGLETPAARAQRGMEPAGKLTLRATQEAGSLLVQLSDDGVGLNRARIRRRAEELGVPELDRFSDDELVRLVLEPGFSTAEVRSDLSGRGVGLDVVRRTVESLRGEVSIVSVEGAGTTISLRLPLTLAIIDGFYVQVGSEVYVIPLHSVTECTDLTDDRREAGDGSGVLHLRGQALPYVRLRGMFAIAGAKAARESVVVVEHNRQRAGIAVDALLGESQTVIKPMGKLLNMVPGISGSTITGDGGVALILDIPALLRRVAAGAERK